MTSRLSRLTFTLCLSFGPLFLASCTTPLRPITGVTVRDSDFEVVKELTSPELAEFEHHWDKKTKLFDGTRAMGRDSRGNYKLDIGRGDRGDRWLYNTSGELTLLTVMSGMADYQVHDVKAFNKLIGATSGTSHRRPRSR